MSTIHNISSTFILAFKWIQSDSKMTTEGMFKSLSIMMGGDGETIKKDQLDKYISDVEAGKMSIDKEGLSALKTMQQNWYRLTDGKDTINVADANCFTALLAMGFASAATSTTPSEPSTEKKDGTSDPKTFEFTDTSTQIDKDATAADLASMLKKLLSGLTDENDDSNAELIATLTNMIASSSDNSTVNVKA